MEIMGYKEIAATHADAPWRMPLPPLHRIHGKRIHPHRHSVTYELSGGLGEAGVEGEQVGQ